MPPVDGIWNKNWGGKANGDLPNAALWFCFSLRAKGGGGSCGLEVVASVHLLSLLLVEGAFCGAAEGSSLPESHSSSSWRCSEVVVSRGGFIPSLCHDSAGCGAKCGWRAAA